MAGDGEPGRLDPPDGPIAVSAASESDLRETRGAIALVASGVAVDVFLCGLPSAEATAVATEAEARAAGVRLRIERTPTGSVDLIVGPREA
jgi:hypothetical protein